ncbi:MAG TPA: hypothetical protein VMT11_13445 [Myxococcaceae bacterium]|nr:hypothetical protein [Myxococcaceae bacterium]
MRVLVLAGFGVLLAACGGGNNGGNNNNNNGTPGLKTFSYGTPQAPTTAQRSTATSAQTQLNAAVNASVNGQVASAASLPSLTDSLAGSLPALLAVPPEPSLMSGGEPQVLIARRTGGLSQGCYTFTSSSISYNNCVISGSGFSETLNGTETVSAGSVSWNLSVTWSYTSGSVTENGTYAWTGQMAITSTTIQGLGRSSFTGHLVSSGTTYDYQYTAGFDSNLTYQTTSSFCLSGGTLEIRRTLNSATNASAIPVHDAAAKYTWSGCGTVTVAKGT